MPINLDSKRLKGYALAFAIACTGSVVFYFLRMPLFVFLGSLTFTLIAAVLDAPIERPARLAIPMRAILGVVVGSAFSPALLARIGSMAGSLVMLVPYTALIAIVGTTFFERVARYDRPTAFFASVPGGITDVALMASDAGANQRAVTLIHAVRLVFMVFSVPVFVAWTGSGSAAGRFAPVIRIWETSPSDYIVLGAIAFIGFQIAHRAHVFGAALIGPMLLSAVVHASGLTSARFPLEVLIVAQVTLGVLLGCQFRGLTFRDITTTMFYGVIFSTILLVLTILVSLLVARITGLERISLLLAYSPGGQAELSLLALILHLDVAFVVLHHLLRLAFVIIGAQVVVLRNKDWRKPPVMSPSSESN